jgi:transposase
MPKPYPKEFRQDVVRVARNREPGQTLKQIAADFGISESCLAGWITQPVPIPASRPTTSAEHRRPKGRTRDGVSSSYWHTTVKHLPGQDIVTMTPPLQLSLLAQARLRRARRAASGAGAPSSRTHTQPALGTAGATDPIHDSLLAGFRHQGR